MERQTKAEIAQSASGIGAFILGLGVAGIFTSFFFPARYFLLISGILLHGWGMFRLASMKDEKGHPVFYRNHWIKLLLWICFLSIVLLIVYLVY